MYFFLSKVLWFFLKPSNVLFALLALGGILTAVGRRRLGRRLIVVAGSAIVLLAVLPVGNVMTRLLENRFPSLEAEAMPETVAGIVVLGGVIDPLVSSERNQLSVGSAMERLLVVPRLARRYPDVPIVFTGGSGRLWHQDAKEGRYFGEVADILGLDRTRLVIEPDSRNTEENATLTKALVKPRPGLKWLLITSAFHMPRSVGVFRRHGWSVVPYPVDYSTRPADGFAPTFDVLGGLARFDGAVHEFLGLLVYRLTGRSDAFFPAPEP